MSPKILQQEDFSIEVGFLVSIQQTPVLIVLREVKVASIIVNVS